MTRSTPGACLEAWHLPNGWVKAWCQRCDRWHFHRLAREGLRRRAHCVTGSWPNRAPSYRLSLRQGSAPSIEAMRARSPRHAAA